MDRPGEKVDSAVEVQLLSKSRHPFRDEESEDVPEYSLQEKSEYPLEQNLESTYPGYCYEKNEVASWWKFHKRDVLYVFLKWFGILALFVIVSMVMLSNSRLTSNLELAFKRIENLKENISKALNDDNEILRNIQLALQENQKSLYDSGDLLNRQLQFSHELHHEIKCMGIPENLYFDCHPEDGASEASCKQRGCCWNPMGSSSKSSNVPLNTPYCYYSKNWHLYTYANTSKDGNEFSGTLKKISDSFYKENLPLIQVDSRSINENILHVKIFDPTSKRYEPPWPIIPDPNPFFQKGRHTENYIFETDEVKPGFRVKRAVDKTTLFQSIDVGGFIFANQFLQISGILPSSKIYGLGEHQSSLRLNVSWQSFTFFNRDQPPTENANLYGSHPFYLIIEDSGKSHGVAFINSNAMDVILQPTPAITFRTIGGIFDMYFFMGPTPADVVRQYSEIVGKPFFPPYWSLGFHLCRYGYRTLDDLKKVWNRTRAAGIPFDTQWNDLDYMAKNNDFTYDHNKYEDLPRFIDELHAVGMHYIPLIDAGISASEAKNSYPPLDEGLKRGVLVKEGDSQGDEPFIGKVWNLVSTAWPDFTNPKTLNYYRDMMQMMHDEIAFDGAWIDMNEPSNFYDGHRNGCTRNKFDYPQYVPNVLGNLLAKNTLCMNARHHLGLHYDLHNTYGTSHAIATNYVLKNVWKRRPFIISRSTWMGHGAYAGHWTGDVFSTWHDLKMSIPAILTFNFLQIPMIGADICGFNGNTTVALCNRWMQLGAFYPFSRNHNSDDTSEQDPVAMGSLVVASSKKALTTRYWLLPYLYTLFYRAHKFGDTVARPLFFEFGEDPVTHDIDTQFLWGSCLMILPVLEEDQTVIKGYFPRSIWYNLYTKEALFSGGKYFPITTQLDTIPLFVRGGCVIPTQKPASTTNASRINNLELLIALDRYDSATGELYWDDGDSLDSIETLQYRWLSLRVENQTLRFREIVKGRYQENMFLGQIRIMGVKEKVSYVYLNNNNSLPFKYDPETKYLSIPNLFLDLKTQFTISWTYSKDDVMLSKDDVPRNIQNKHVLPSVNNQDKDSSSSFDFFHFFSSGASNHAHIDAFFYSTIVYFFLYRYYYI